jgi:DDE family transposase
MAIIARTLAFIKSDPLLLLGGAARVDECFAGIGHVWRERVLTPAVTMKLFILQVLHGNTAISALRHLTNIDVADSSYCQARARLPLAGVAAAVSQLCCEGGRSIENAAAWLGRRVLMTDATSVTTPDTPALQKLWPQPQPHKAGCGFPAIKLLCLLDLATGMIMQVTMMCMNVHEMSQLAGPHAGLRRGDVLMGDRAFCSFAHLVLLVAMSVDAVFRTHQAQIIDYAPNRPHRRRTGEKNKGDRGKGRGYEKGLPSSRFVRRLGKEDQVVEWFRPANRPTWMSEADYAALPQTLEVRELRYRITARGMRTRQVDITTTLLDPMRYPKHEIARLYGLRWEIETNFRHLKTTMTMAELKCKSPDGATKELMIFVLVYNMVRAAMVAAAERQGVADANRISFIDAMRFLQSVVTGVHQGEMRDLIVNPPRTGRSCPRVIKRRMKSYDLMNKPRSEYAEPRAEADVMC